MPDYSKQIANAISAMTKRSADAIGMLSTGGSSKRALRVSEILDLRYDIPCDVSAFSEEDSYLWAENCGSPLSQKRG